MMGSIPQKKVNLLATLTDASREMAPVDPILLLRSLDTMSDLALIYDRHSSRVYLNKAAQSLGEMARAFDPHLSEVFRTRERVVVQASLETEAGRRSFETIYTPICGDNGSPQFVIAIAREKP